MSIIDHFGEAERFAALADEWMDADWGWKAELSTEERIARRAADLAAAQVHATLALAATSDSSVPHPTGYPNGGAA